MFVPHPTHDSREMTQRTIEHTAHTHDLHVTSVTRGDVDWVVVLPADVSSDVSTALINQDAVIVDFRADDWEVFEVTADNTGNLVHPDTVRGQDCDADASFDSLAGALQHAADALTNN